MNGESVRLVNKLLTEKLNHLNLGRNNYIFGHFVSLVNNEWTKDLISYYENELSLRLKFGIQLGIENCKFLDDSADYETNGFPVYLLQGDNEKQMKENIQMEFEISRLLSKELYIVDLSSSSILWSNKIMNMSYQGDKRMTREDIFTFVYYFEDDKILSGEVEVRHCMSELKEQLSRTSGLLK